MEELVIATISGDVAKGGNSRLWTARKVPFVFEDGFPYGSDVLDAMNQIENNTRIWFCRRGNEASYIKFVAKMDGEASGSLVGMQPVDAQPQTIGLNAGYKALHEIGHALGLIHEQCRPDRDTYIDLQWDHIAPDKGWDGNDKTKKNRQFTIDEHSVAVTNDYDRNSVMHYPAPAKGWQGIPADQSVWTMRWKADAAKQLGGGATGPSDPNAWKKLTQLDIDGLNHLYDTIPGWSRQQQVPGVGTTDSPALAAFQNQLHLAWKGGGTDRHIWWSRFDGSKWSAQEQVPEVGTTGGPALAVLQNQLYLAWKGGGDRNILWSRFDGSKWSPQQQVPGVGTAAAPALAAFQDQLYLAWQGNGDRNIWWSRFDGSKWSAQQQVPNVGTANVPALAAFQDQLYLAWQGNGDQNIWWSRFDGSKWSAQQQVPNVGTSSGPTLAGFQSRLFLTWQGSGDQHIWYADFDGSTNPWSGQVRIAEVGTKNGPTLAEFQKQLYLSWKGSSDENIWYAHFSL